MVLLPERDLREVDLREEVSERLGEEGVKVDPAVGEREFGDDIDTTVSRRVKIQSRQFSLFLITEHSNQGRNSREAAFNSFSLFFLSFLPLLKKLLKLPKDIPSPPPPPALELSYSREELRLSLSESREK